MSDSVGIKHHGHVVFISPNEVFGDIMVLASPPRPPHPCPPRRR